MKLGLCILSLGESRLWSILRAVLSQGINYHILRMPFFLLDWSYITSILRDPYSTALGMISCTSDTHHLKLNSWTLCLTQLKTGPPSCNKRQRPANPGYVRSYIGTLVRKAWVVDLTSLLSLTFSIPISTYFTPSGLQSSTMRCTWRGVLPR